MGATVVLAQQRRRHILELVRHHGGVRVADLVVELGVSAMTVRRDLGRLAHDGLLDRVHGGVVTPVDVGTATGLDLVGESRARLAGAVIGTGARVLLLGGRSAVAVAHSLADVRRLTVMTDSLVVAAVLARSAGADRSLVMCSGGADDDGDGQLLTASLQHLRPDWVVLDADGVDGHAGLTCRGRPRIDGLRDPRLGGARVVVLVDGHTWGSRSSQALGSFADVDVLVSDDDLPVAVRARIAAEVGRLLLAPTSSRGAAPPIASGADTLRAPSSGARTAVSASSHR